MKSLNPERDDAIWIARSNGMSYSKIGDMFGLTRERCRQIFTKTNFIHAMQETHILLDRKLDDSYIARIIQGKYQIQMTPETVRFIQRTRQQGKKNFSLQRMHCYACEFAVDMPTAHCHLCRHPARSEPLLYRGKNHPRDCPLLPQNQ